MDSDGVIPQGQDTILPFCFFHQTVIIAIAFYIVQWNAGILLKLPVIALASCVVTHELTDAVYQASLDLSGINFLLEV